jgi:hypothetical protein
VPRRIRPSSEWLTGAYVIMAIPFYFVEAL